MRSSILCIPLLAACLVLSSAGTARAQEFASDVSAYCNTYIQLDEENGLINAQAYVYTSYVYNLYYDIEVRATLRGGEQYDYQTNYSHGQSLLYSQDLWTYLWVEAWADTEYKVWAEYTVKFYYDGSYGYYDFWDFSRYAFLQVYEPNFYDFIGYFTRQMYNNSSSTNVGTVHSNKKTGVPHHVKVYSDVNREVPGCGSYERIIKYQVVDSSGKPVGTTSTREVFSETQHGIELPFVNNTCVGADSYIYPSECSVDKAGIIVDGLFVGCAAGGDCGTSDFMDSWVTCQSGKPAFAVTSNLYHPRAQEMLINNVFQYPKGTQLY